MKVSLNWIKEYIKFKQSLPNFLEELTMKSVEVEGVTDYAKLWEGVVVGKVIHLKKHPSADRLHLAKVDTGIKILDIVCGGVNLKEDQYVPVATVGTQLPSGVVIKKAIIRGQESEGMICSCEELALPKESSKEILVLSNALKVGTPLVKALALDLPVIDINVLPDRADLMGHIGVAREIAAITDSKFSPDTYKLPKKTKNTLPLKVKIQDANICPRFSALVIDNFTVKDAPEWMKARLRAIGIRSINNIIDLTNYLMFDLGTPFHAFDYDVIKNKTMFIRKSRPGESVVTLDDVKRELPSGSAVIEDGERIIDLAGIMGGKNSAINKDTRRIVLEVAEFQSTTIRKTSRSLGHRTDAVSFFEKGIDRTNTLNALAKAYDLLKEMDHDVQLDGVIDLYPKKYEPKQITFHYKRYKQLIGKTVTSKQTIKILESLGYKIGEKTVECIEVTPPAYRRDVSIEEDIIEDVIRMVGYDTLGEVLPTVDLQLWKTDAQIDFVRAVQETLKTFAFYEVVNYSFISPAVVKKMDLKEADHIALVNPLNKEQSLLRTELLSSLLVNAEKNQKRSKVLKFFELANIYFPPKEGEMPREKKHLSGIIIDDGLNLCDIKGVIETLMQSLRIPGITFEKQYHKEIPCDTELQSTIMLINEPVGYFGLLSSTIQENFDIEKRVWCFSVDIQRLFSKKREVCVYKPLDRYPGVYYDLAIIVDQKITWKEMESVIKAEDNGLVQKIELFDIYTGKQVPKGKKSVAFHLVYQSLEKTLTQEEVEPIHRSILKRLQKELGAELRK